MTAALAAPAPSHLLPRQLVTTTVLVVAAHALLLLGLPHLRHASESSMDTGTFSTRRVAPPAPAAPVAPPAPTAEPVVKAPPPPKPNAAARKPRAQPAPTAQTAPSAAPQTPGPAGPIEPSLLHPKPTGMGSFGGGAAPVPITPPMPADAAGSALELAQTLGDDTPVRIPRAAELGFQAHGTIGGQAFTVPVTLQWRQDGQWYESRFGFYNPKVGERTRQVTGLITPQGLAPAAVQMRVPDVQEIRFDYGSGRVSFSASDTDTPLAAGMLDRLSVLIQLGALLAGDPERYPAGTAIVLPAAHERGEGSWRFAVEPDEELSALRDKMLPTAHLVHIPFDDQSPRIEVWLGRTLDYLPVRVLTTEPNGDTVEYNLVTAYAQPTPTAAPSQPAASTP